jgi:hypothetical protein
MLFAFGCTASRSILSLDPLLRTGIESQQTVFALEGEVLSSHDEEPFKVLDFRMSGNQALSGELILHLLVYKRTMPGKPPTNALILVERTSNGTLNVLGRDGYQSVVESSSENVATIRKRFRDHEILPSRRLRLRASSAIAIANEELKIEDARQFKIAARRIAFGWEVFYQPRGELRSIGDEATVVVSDDKTVLAVQRGF